MIFEAKKKNSRIWVLFNSGALRWESAVWFFPKRRHESDQISQLNVAIRSNGTDAWKSEVSRKVQEVLSRSEEPTIFDDHRDLLSQKEDSQTAEGQV